MAILLNLVKSTINTATLIDNIFTNSSRNSFNGIFLSDISDYGRVDP